MSTPKKRFIAGAICPRCAAMDRLVMFTNAEGTFRECVSCGYEDKQETEGGPHELVTRVNKKRNEDDHGIKPVVIARNSD